MYGFSTEDEMTFVHYDKSRDEYSTSGENETNFLLTLFCTFCNHLKNNDLNTEVEGFELLVCS